MVQTANITSHDALIKDVFGDNVDDALYDMSFLYNKVTKDEKFGKNIHVPVQVTAARGTGSTFEAASAQMEASVTREFIVNSKTLYKNVAISGQLYAISGLGNSVNVVNEVTLEFETARDDLFNEVSHQMWGNAGGSRGRIDASTNLASQTVQLATPSDIIYIEENMKLAVAVDDGSANSPAGLKGAPNYITVATVNREAGSFTISEASLSGAIPAIAAGDYLFLQSTYGQCVSGVPAWLPVVAPTSGDNFHSLDRSTDPRRLAGLRSLAFSGQAMDAVLLRSTALGDREGVKAKCGVINSEQFADLQLTMGSERVRNSGSDSTIGFKNMMVDGGMGNLPLISDRYAPPGYAWFFDPKDYTIHSTGKMCRILDHGAGGSDGGVLADQRDAKVYRLGCYWAMSCQKVSNGMVAQF